MANIRPRFPYVRQPIKFIDELVDLAVSGIDLTLKAGFPLWVVRG